MGENEVTIELASLSKLKPLLILGFLAAVFIVQVQLTLNSPIAFGDEGYHVSIAREMGENREYYVYNPLQGTDAQDVQYNRPPLWNMIEASFYMIFGFSDTLVKILVPLMSMLTGLVVYSFGRKLYSENVGIIAAILTVTIPSFVTYSILFYTTVPFTFFASIALFSFMYAAKIHSRKYLLVSAIFSGLAIMANIAGLFMIMVMLFYGIYEVLRSKRLMLNVKRYGIPIIIAILIVSPWIARNVAEFYVPGCTSIQAIIQGSCSTPSTYAAQYEFTSRTNQGGTEIGILAMGIPQYLQFAYGFGVDQIILGSVFLTFIISVIGFSFVPFIALGGLFLAIKRKINTDVVLVLAALVFALIFYQIGGLSVDGRAEDLSRYFVVAVPMMSLLGAMYFEEMTKLARRYQNHAMIAVMVIVLVIGLTSLTQKLDTMEFVKQFSPAFFQACDWIKTNTEADSTLMSLHVYPTIYNCDRQAEWEMPDKADILLSNDLSLIDERMKVNGFDYIFVQKFSMSYEPLGQAWPISFVQLLEANPDKFQKVYENGPSLQECLQAGGCDGTSVYKVL